MAVGTPTASHVDDDDLAFETRVGLTDDTARQVGEVEPEGSPVLHRRMARWIGRLGQPLGQGIFDTNGGERRLAVLNKNQRSVLGWRHFEQQRSGTGEVA